MQLQNTSLYVRMDPFLLTWINCNYIMTAGRAFLVAKEVSHHYSRDDRKCQGYVYIDMK